MISEIVSEIKKIEADGTNNIKIAQESCAVKVKEIQVKAKIEFEKKQAEILNGYEKEIIKEKGKINLFVIQNKKQIEDERQNLIKKIEPNLDKAINFIVKKVS